MTQTPLPTADAFTASWQGINHLALVTADMDATVRFYHGTLGARLVSTIATADFRHYFFEFGRNAPWLSSNTPTPPSNPSPNPPAGPTCEPPISTIWPSTCPTKKPSTHSNDASRLPTAKSPTS
jgi:Glyoxalase/Bleomycin resistance protein/Dioxygenase superfamily